MTVTHDFDEVAVKATNSPDGLGDTSVDGDTIKSDVSSDDEDDDDWSSAEDDYEDDED